MRVQLIKVTFTQLDSLVLQHVFPSCKESVCLVLLRIDVLRVSQRRFNLCCSNFFFLELGKFSLEFGGRRAFFPVCRGT